jgi:autotransporter-associated beta strand protein
MRTSINAAGNDSQQTFGRCRYGGGGGKRLIAIAAVAAIGVGAGVARTSSGAAFTWDGVPDGGGASADANWSTATNWVGDLAPGATGNTLVFAASTGLLNTNDVVTALVNGTGATDGSITFAAGAGSFTLGGSTINWETDANGWFIANNSGVNQTIDLGFFDVTPGSRDRNVNANGATITLNGDINFGNDRLFPTQTAGTIVLNGNNIGDGTGAAITAGTNQFRSTVRNNVANTQLVLGSATAVGNANVDFANRRGVVANQPLFLSANTDLTGANAVNSTFVINSNWIDYNGTNNLEMGGLIVQGGNRDFKVTGAGSVTVSGQGVALSADQTTRALFLNASGSGTLTFAGPIHDTFHTGGIVTTVNDPLGNPTRSILRAGAGKIVINADNSTTFTGDFRIHNNASVQIGHAGALGAAGAGSGTDIDSGGTLDLNGLTISENFYGLDGAGVGGVGAIINSNIAASAGIASIINNVGSFTVGGAGDIELQRVHHTVAVPRTLTKIGSGTLTLGGAGANDRYGVTVLDGTVNLHKSGTDAAVINNPLLISGTPAKAVLTGAGSNQIHDLEQVQVINGTFDMNGHSETAGTLTIGDGATNGTIMGAGSTYTVSTGSAIEALSGTVAVNLAGDAALNKASGGTVTLSGVNTYTGATTASGGKLVLGKSLTTSSAVSALNDATIELANDGSHNQFVKADSVTIDPGATIDLKDNKLLTSTPAGTFTAGAYTGIQGEVARAYNFGAWDLPGLKTSEELAGPNAGPLSGTTTIGVATGEQILFLGPADTGVFAGQTITGATTIAMYTYAGDMNFDGLVDAADYGVIDNWVQFPGSDGYANGDLNYDGVIDAADYGIIDNTIQLQGAPFPGWDSPGSIASASLSGVTAVPEPASLSVLGLAAASLLDRRRRRRPLA